MTDKQKKVIKALIELADEYGRGLFPLSLVSEKSGVTDLLFDPNTETGVMWEISQFDKGFIYIHGSSACINVDLEDQLKRWCRE